MEGFWKKAIWNWINKEHPEAVKNRIREHLHAENLSRRDLLRSLNYRRYPAGMISTVLEEMILNGEIVATPQVKAKGRPRSNVLSLTRVGRQKWVSYWENWDNVSLRWNSNRKMKPEYWLNR
jgi:hypothetical protein